MFYEKFSELCFKKGESMSSVMRAVGASNGLINNWKNGGTPRNATMKKIADHFGVSVSYFDEEATTVSGPIPMMVPVYGAVSAGNGVLAEDLITGYEMAPPMGDAREFFYLTVHGDSMRPRLEEGDLVLVHRQNDIDCGDVGVFLVDGEDGVIKRIDYSEGRITLISFNPFYPPREFTGNDVSRVRPLGKVISMTRRF